MNADLIKSLGGTPIGVQLMQYLMGVERRVSELETELRVLRGQRFYDIAELEARIGGQIGQAGENTIRAFCLVGQEIAKGSHGR